MQNENVVALKKLILSQRLAKTQEEVLSIRQKIKIAKDKINMSSGDLAYVLSVTAIDPPTKPQQKAPTK